MSPESENIVKVMAVEGSELVTNGDFETFDFTGWDAGALSADWQVDEDFGTPNAHLYYGMEPV